MRTPYIFTTAWIPTRQLKDRSPKKKIEIPTKLAILHKQYSLLVFDFVRKCLLYTTSCRIVISYDWTNLLYSCITVLSLSVFKWVTSIKSKVSLGPRGAACDFAAVAFGFALRFGATVEASPSSAEDCERFTARNFGSAFAFAACLFCSPAFVLAFFLPSSSLPAFSSFVFAFSFLLFFSFSSFVCLVSFVHSFSFLLFCSFFVFVFFFSSLAFSFSFLPASFFPLLLLDDASPSASAGVLSCSSWLAFFLNLFLGGSVDGSTGAASGASYSGVSEGSMHGSSSLGSSSFPSSLCSSHSSVWSAAASCSSSCLVRFAAGVLELPSCRPLEGWLPGFACPHFLG